MIALPHDVQDVLNRRFDRVRAVLAERVAAGETAFVGADEFVDDAIERVTTEARYSPAGILEAVRYHYPRVGSLGDNARYGYNRELGYYWVRFGGRRNANGFAMDIYRVYGNLSRPEECQVSLFEDLRPPLTKRVARWFGRHFGWAT